MITILVVVLSQVLGGCHRSHAGNCARVYFHDQCHGSSRSLGQGSERFVGHHWNDQISSLVVREGCEFIVYEHHNFEGKHWAFRDTKTRLRDVGTKNLWYKRHHWNDRISSWKCACKSKSWKKDLANAFTVAAFNVFG